MTWPTYSAACRSAVDDLLRKGGSLSAYRANPQVGVEPTKGSYAWKFEREAEKRFKVKHCVAVNSGTAALHAGLVGLNLRGGEVITSPYSFSATVSAILLAGGVPRFADVDPLTFNITPETVKHALTKRTRAILPVHLFGQLADVRGLKTFGLPIVEDACQSVGARNADGFSGTQGIAGGASANGGKNIPAGEFGFLTTNDDRIAAQARYLMNHGENFGQKVVGLNLRPNEVTACIAFHGLLELEERNAERRAAAMFFPTKITDEYIEDPVGDYYKEHALYVLPMLYQKRNPGRDLFCKRLRKMGVQVGEGYITPTLNRYPAFRKYQRAPLPVVERLSSRELVIFSQAVPDYDGKELARIRRCIEEACE